MSQEYDKGTANGFLGTAFVSFLSCRETNRFLDKFSIKGQIFDRTGFLGTKKNNLILQMGYMSCDLSAEIAPEPRDIIWENQAY